jgi:tetratricopeptide (TPR) repeat protein
MQQICGLPSARTTATALSFSERYERVHGQDHVLTIERLSELGYAYSLFGDHATAARIIQDALDRCGKLAPGHALASEVRMTLGAAQAKAGRAEAALENMDTALAAMRASAEPQPLMILRAEMQRTGVLFKLRRWSDAEQSSAATIAALEATGVADVRLAEAKMSQGMCRLELGRPAEAEGVLIEAEALWRAHAPRHTYLRLTHRCLVKVYETTGQTAQAETWREAARQWEAAGNQQKQ